MGRRRVGEEAQNVSKAEGISFCSGWFTCILHARNMRNGHFSSIN